MITKNSDTEDNDDLYEVVKAHSVSNKANRRETNKR